MRIYYCITRTEHSQYLIHRLIEVREFDTDDKSAWDKAVRRFTEYAYGGLGPGSYHSFLIAKNPDDSFLTEAAGQLPGQSDWESDILS